MTLTVEELNTIISNLKDINRAKEVKREGYDESDSLYCPNCNDLVGTNGDG